MNIRLTHRYIRIDAQVGFRSLDLAQLDGTLLALDWVVGATHHIWGSAVIVAPGVALTARHVVDEMRNNGFLSEGGGYLLALGFHNDGMVIWNPDSFTSIEDSDLSILTPVRATAQPANTAKTVIPVVAAQRSTCWEVSAPSSMFTGRGVIESYPIHQSAYWRRP